MEFGTTLPLRAWYEQISMVYFYRQPMANKPNFKMENGPIVLISGWSFDFPKGTNLFLLPDPWAYFRLRVRSAYFNHPAIWAFCLRGGTLNVAG